MSHVSSGNVHLSCIFLHSVLNEIFVTFFSSFDGWNFKDKTDSTFPHRLATAMASYEGKPLITGIDVKN